MRNLILTAICAGIVGAPALAAAQASAGPVASSGTTAKTVGASTITLPTGTPNNGGNNSASATAHETLAAIRSVCTLVENDGKLFAACDNTTAAARLRGGPTYVPQLSTEWEAFTKRLANADLQANGKRRPVVVLNKGEVVAEATAGGMVTLKK